MINKARHKKSETKLREYEDQKIKRLRERLSNSTWEALDAMKSLEYKKQILQRLEHTSTSIFYIERVAATLNASQKMSKSAIRPMSFRGDDSDEEINCFGSNKVDPTEEKPC